MLETGPACRPRGSASKRLLVLPPLLPLLPLRRPGEADLSVDVDFDAVRRAARSEAAGLRVSPLLDQRDFLAAMGLEPR